MTDKFNGLIKVAQYQICEALGNYEVIYNHAKTVKEDAIKSMKENIVRETLFLRKPVSEYDELIESTYCNYHGFNKSLRELGKITKEQSDALLYSRGYLKEVVLFPMTQFSKIQSDAVFITPKQAEFINKYGKSQFTVLHEKQLENYIQQTRQA